MKNPLKTLDKKSEKRSAKVPMKRIIEPKIKRASERIELEVFGMTNGMDRSRPVILFREKGGESILPVWLSPIDAGIALTQNSAQSVAISPHEVTLGVLTQLGVKLEECDFRELKGHLQYVDLKFSGSKKVKTMNVRADHAISFCLQAKAKFYCTRGYIQKCRDVDAEVGQGQVMLGSKADARRGRSLLLN